MNIGYILSALIAGVIAFVLYTIFAMLLGGASLGGTLGTSLIYGVATFAATLIISYVIGNVMSRKNT